MWMETSNWNEVLTIPHFYLEFYLTLPYFSMSALPVPSSFPLTPPALSLPLLHPSHSCLPPCFSPTHASLPPTPASRAVMSVPEVVVKEGR
ncbi:hypothetical protein Pmani_021685 [Petrolisthes manimaculis]|uniref:Uncharacterized protein n=1 Tax=Petrolisthes manimaculis TaxID=1843537 RepID=A0AAE1PEA1_9EUCA|nr:hypothetical protein Pmani_021685 [Petrolisthes manimaculis]